MTLASTKLPQPLEGALWMDYSIFNETMANLTWKQIESLAQNKAIVLLPCDPLEEHGPTMPITVDVYFCYIVTLRIRDLLEQRSHDVVIAPPNYWGICNTTGAFPGTFTLRKETLKLLLYDILGCLKRWGFEHVFVISLHGDPSHRNAIAEAVADARMENGIRARFIIPYRRARYSGYKGYEDYLLVQPPEHDQVWDYYIQMKDGHSGSMETSFITKYYPEFIDEAETRKLKPTSLSTHDVKKWSSGWSECREAIPDGYYGNPALIEPGRVEELIEAEAKSHAELIDSYLKGDYVPPRME